MIATVVAVWLSGCQRPLDLRQRLESPDPTHRIEAIRMVGEGHRVTLAPALVDRLDDEDPAVRLYAIVALEQLTGTRLGYRYAAPRPARLEAIDRWRAHIKAAAAGQESTTALDPPPGA